MHCYRIEIAGTDVADPASDKPVGNEICPAASVGAAEQRAIELCQSTAGSIGYRISVLDQVGGQIALSQTGHMVAMRDMRLPENAVPDLAQRLD